MSWTETQEHRWSAVVRSVAEMVPDGAVVSVEGSDELASRLAAHGVTVGPTGDVLVRAKGPRAVRPPTAGPRVDADVVVDLRDPGWPVIRHVAAHLSNVDRWHLTESRAFFAAKAATWNSKFGSDLPAYGAAVAEAGFRAGGVLVDVGCGTGRALPALRSAAGPTGVVVGLDLTPEMLAEARDSSVSEHAPLVLGDASRLPFATASVDGAFAAGLLMHLPDPDAGLRELARITRPGGRLAFFQPTSRAALAARHGRELRPDEPLNESPLRESTTRAGWHLEHYDDAEERFFAVASRV
ncbi:class I SAM-dependent methyltransferase [Cryptosporangium sp. NPDC048952]|uniref:class I SAM-dependent methyltransferase n=1 Tax=Cryptosporangium sp. NPDC048952 TaxID=3363961 RepID=UPI00371FE42D